MPSPRLPATRSAPIRYPELDALRGVAALIVFVSHAVMVPSIAPYVAVLDQTPLAVLWNGPAAVDIFFVLSGFVLSLKLVAEPLGVRGYLQYAIRRVARIYPALWVAVLLTVALMFWPGPPSSCDHLSSWMCAFWREPVVVEQMTKTLVLVWPGTNTDLYDPVLWTLVIEIKASLLLPFLLVPMRSSLAVRHPLAVDAGLLLILCAVCWTFGTMLALPLFLIGALLAKHHALWSSRRVHPAISFALVALAAALSVHDNILRARWGMPGAHMLVSGLGATLFIQLLLVDSPVRRAFQSRPFVFLGDISYGFYLVHMPLMIACVALIPPLGLACVAALLSSIVVATALRSVVELPFQKLGSRLARAVPKGLHGKPTLIGADK